MSRDVAASSGEGWSAGGARYVTKDAALEVQQRRHQEPPTKALSACRDDEGEAGDEAAGGRDARTEGP